MVIFYKLPRVAQITLGGFLLLTLSGSLDKRTGGVPASGITLGDRSPAFQNVDRPNHIGIFGIATFDTLKFGLGWAIFFVCMSTTRTSSAGVVWRNRH